MAQEHETTTALTVQQPGRALERLTPDPALVEQALTIGDVGKMSPAQRIAYYLALCESMSLNPLTKPFTPIQGDDGTIQFYPNKSCTEQLRKSHRVSLKTTERRREGDIYLVTIIATLPDGRTSEAQGAVSLVKQKGTWKTSQNGKRFFEAALDQDGEPVYLNLRGDALANAMMKAETKAARRATLAICGLTDAPAAGHELQMQLTSGTFVVQSDDTEETTQRTFQNNVADLYGVEADEQMEPQTLTPTPHEEAAHQHIAAIENIMRIHGANPAAIHEYWQRTCKRFKVASPRTIKVEHLERLALERQEYYEKRNAAALEVTAELADAESEPSGDIPF